MLEELAGLAGLNVRQLVQLFVGILALVALIVGGGMVLHWKHEAAKAAGYEKEIANYAQTISRMRTDIDNSRKASAGYQSEVERLRAANASRPVPVVRVCRDSTALHANTGGAAGGRLNAPATPGRILPPAPGGDIGPGLPGPGDTVLGPDIGPQLAGDADLADSLSAQIRGLHTYIAEVCHAKSP